MSKWRDIVDWVGGYPYEAAKADEVFAFFRARGFSLEYPEVWRRAGVQRIRRPAPQPVVLTTSRARVSPSPSS